MRKMIFGLLLLSTSVHAEETRFFCTTEDAINSIAAKIVVNQNAADEAAQPFIKEGTCLYLPWDVHIDIVYRGKIFGEKDFHVAVVGFTDGDKSHMFYGLMPAEVNSI